MTGCLDTDAILAIGDALNWDVAEGLRHLDSCDDCRAQLDILRLTRVGFSETERVDTEVLRRISAALGQAARSERSRVRLRERVVHSIEVIMAGVTALIILVSSGIEIQSIGAGALGFTLGAALMAGGKTLARNLPALGYQGRQV
jgi:hypothetical protein